MEVWITFLLASTLILVVPGPTILLVISQSIAHGRSSVVPLVAGVLLGDFTAMVMSFLGLGAVISTSAAVFTVLKWLGAAYLVYLGIDQLRSRPGIAGESRLARGSGTPWSLLRRSYIVTALNPKSIAFFIAFLPQFIDPMHPVASQFMAYGGTFLLLATVNAAVYAYFAASLRAQIRRQRVQKWFHRCGGGALIGAGVLTATMTHGS